MRLLILIIFASCGQEEEQPLENITCVKWTSLECSDGSSLDDTSIPYGTLCQIEKRAGKFGLACDNGFFYEKE